MIIIKMANLLLRFLLELCLLASLGYWGFKIDKVMIVKIGLGIGAPLLAALVWGMFIAPRSSIQVPWQIRLLLEFIVLSAAVIALYASGHPTLAKVFTVVWVINGILMYVWKQ
ncbi:MAG TPA: YrdB family protein [Neobacillus sp.]